MSCNVAPPIVTCTPVSVNVSAGQPLSIEGAIEKTPFPPDWSLDGPAPIVPVSPTAVTWNVPPMAGCVVETEIDVILFAFAEMTLSTSLKPSPWVQTSLDPI